MRDLENRKDIELLLRAFYNKALVDPLIGTFFTDIAQIDLEAHLPHITDFWDQQLFRATSYRKNVLQIHKDLHAKKALDLVHFETWLALFNTTVDEIYTGTNAELIKTRALSIMTVMRVKLDS